MEYQGDRQDLDQNLLRIWSDLDLVRSDQNWSEFDQINWL